MRPAMYIFLNRKLGMSTGKAGAQTAHAAVEAYRISHSQMLNAWYEGGHYCKLVMSAENADQLSIIRHYLAERGFNTKLIIDEGRTEIEPFSVTALGVEVVDRDDPHVKATFEGFKLYKDKKKKRKRRKKS